MSKPPLLLLPQTFSTWPVHSRKVGLGSSTHHLRRVEGGWGKRGKEKRRFPKHWVLGIHHFGSLPKSWAALACTSALAETCRGRSSPTWRSGVSSQGGQRGACLRSPGRLLPARGGPGARVGTGARNRSRYRSPQPLRAAAPTPAQEPRPLCPRPGRSRARPAKIRPPQNPNRYPTGKISCAWEPLTGAVGVVKCACGSDLNNSDWALRCQSALLSIIERGGF